MADNCGESQVCYEEEQHGVSGVSHRCTPRADPEKRWLLIRMVVAV